MKAERLFFIQTRKFGERIRSALVLVSTIDEPYTV